MTGFGSTRTTVAVLAAPVVPTPGAAGATALLTLAGVVGGGDVGSPGAGASRGAMGGTEERAVAEAGLRDVSACGSTVPIVIAGLCGSPA